MKKQNLFKIILFCILGYVILTWFVQAGSISGTEIIHQGLTRIGIKDALLYSLLTFEFRSGYILFVLVVGAFFGILSKSSKYSNLINKLSKPMKGIGWGSLVILPLSLMLLSVILNAKLALWLTIVLSIVDVLISGGLIWYGLMDNKRKLPSLFGALSILPLSIITVLLITLPKMALWLKIAIVVVAIVLTVLLIVFGAKKSDKKYSISRSLFIVLPTSLVLSLAVSQLVKITWLFIVLLFVVLILTAFSVKFVNQSNRVAISYITVFFVLLTAICGFNVTAFVFIPFFVSIIIAMGYDRISAFAATFGATLVGVIGSIFNYQVNAYFNYSAGIEGFTSDLIAKLALLIIPTVLFIFFVDKRVSTEKKSDKKGNKKDDKEIEDAKEDVFELAEKDTKSSTVGITIVLALTMLVLILSVTGWANVFNINFFNEITNKVMTFEIGKHAIIKYILSEFTAFGNYAVEEVTALLAISAIIVMLVCRIKFSDAKDGIVEGLKKTIVPAFIMAFASALFLLSNYISPAIITIEGWLVGLTKEFNILTIFTSTIDVFVGALFSGDSVLFAQQSAGLVANAFPQQANLMALLIQSMFGAASMVLPTSAILVLGLEYLNIPYTKWIKTSWKTLLEIFVVILIILIVLFLI